MLRNIIRRCSKSIPNEEVHIVEILKNVAALIKVKTIVTLVVVAIYAYLAITGKINADNVMQLTLMVVSFYFGTQHEKK